MKNWFFNLARDPWKSLKRFLMGLGMFAVSMGLIYFGYKGHHGYQMAGLAIMPFALFFAIWGYLGIFAHRFQSFKRKK